MSIRYESRDYKTFHQLRTVFICVHRQTGMDMRILVPIDGSEPAKKALEHALVRFPEASLTVLHVINPVDAGHSMDGFSAPVFDELEVQADQLLDEAVSVAKAHDRELTTARELGRPARAILDYADENEFDHIVIGSHGRTGVSRILLGSIAETVVRRASVPVTVVR